MDAGALERMLDEAFDHAIVRHGFTDYMRDYEVVVFMTADPRTGIEPSYVRYLFRHCVEARCETAVPAETWERSLDDRLIDHETGVDLEGFVWGVKWQPMYPGAKVLPASDASRRWSRALGLDFHEVLIETNTHRLTLIFSELRTIELTDDERSL
ncbi:hypothetical protein ACIPSE_28960 [Streptomyces sp. NPDC090106]|uniref:YxiG-like protein n=1 Tax=Streptomyces sp. NPDC090106 TaxID=3365946 RepID=UPI0037F1BCBF